MSDLHIYYQATGIELVTRVAMVVPSEMYCHGSPITGDGQFVLGWNPQPRNVIFAGPTGLGGSELPIFRALVTQDLPITPNVPYSVICFGGSGSTSLQPVGTVGTSGQVLTSNGANQLPTWQAGGSGTVTSVAMTVPSILSVSGTPITTSGTLAVTLATEVANTVLSGPASGADATPTFRALVAGDIPNLAASVITSGTLPIARGGTNSGTALNNNRILVSSGGAIVEAAAMTNGQLLIGSTGAAPVVATLTAGTSIAITNAAGAITVAITGAVAVANGGTNSTTALSNNRIMVSSGGAVVEAGAMTNGQLLIGSTAAAPVVAALTGTANQVTVTNGAGSITLATPQSIGTGSSPTFASMTLTATLQVLAAHFGTEVNDGNSGTAITVNWANGNKHKVTMTGNATFTFTAPAGACNLILRLVQDATGSRTATWPATVKWAGAAAPTLTTTANAVDIIAFYWDGVNYHGAASLNFA